jgi:DNA-binding LacI/PurR family transcriptional regulator
MSDSKRRTRQPTLVDVARVAGVNRVTASIAMRGPQPGSRSGTRISEATRQRVLAAAQEIGYAPNAIALALRRQRTDMIGFYAGTNNFYNMHHPFTAAVMNGLRWGCEQHQRDLVLFGSFSRRSDDEIYAALASGKLDGLVVQPVPHTPVIEMLARSHLPAVAIANRTAGIPSVTVDDVGGSQLLVAHLAQKGHRRILYRDAPVPHVSTSVRQQAFVQAAVEHQIEVVISPATNGVGNLSPFEEELFTRPLSQRPTAAVCWADPFAYRLLDECERIGLRVPDDLAVAGFDGVPTAFPLLRKLTTIRAPWQAVGEQAIQFILELLDGRTVAPETMYPVELVVGDTT